MGIAEMICVKPCLSTLSIIVTVVCSYLSLFTLCAQ